MIELLFISLFQAAAGAPAEPPADAPAPAAQTEEAEPDWRDRPRCRNIAHTGSRIASERRCTTPRQDEEMARESARSLRETQSQSGRSGWEDRT